MKIQNIMIGTLFVSIIVALSIVYISNLASYNNLSFDSSKYFNNTNENIANVVANSKSMSSSVSKLVVDITNLNVFAIPFDLIKLSWGFLRTTFTSLSTFTGMIPESINILSNELPSAPGVGFTLSDIIVTIITLLVIFSIIFAAIRWKVES